MDTKKIKAITLTTQSYPELIDAVNEISQYHQRKPHDMIRVLVARELINVRRKNGGKA